MKKRTKNPSRKGALPARMAQAALPEKGTFKAILLSLYERAKAAPALYIKERSLDDARRLQNMALAVEARDFAAHAGKVIILIEKDIADSNPPAPPKDRGRGHKNVNPELTFSGATLSTMRRAYSGLSPKAVADRADAIIKEGGVPTRAGFLSEFRTREKERRIEAAKQRRHTAASKKKLKDFQLFNKSIAQMQDHLPAESVDFILTDPPYDRPGVPTYKELSHFAGKVLKPGGALIAMSGHAFLRDILNNICESPLIKYHWALTYCMYKGRTARIRDRRMFSSSKPLLMMVKGRWRRPWMNDTVMLPPLKDGAQDYHKWAQAPEGFKLILEKGFADPGDVVCDPFLGGGASGLAALQHGCRFVGSDKDSECVKISRGRLIAAAAEGGF